jgi:hypothetical protein
MRGVTRTSGASGGLRRRWSAAAFWPSRIRPSGVLKSRYSGTEDAHASREADGLNSGFRVPLRSATATLLAMATNGSESSLGHAESGLPVARWSVARRHTGQEHQVIISSYHREHSRRVDHVGAAQSRRRGKTLQEAKWRTYVRTRQSITRPRLPYGERNGRRFRRGRHDAGDRWLGTQSGSRLRETCSGQRSPLARLRECAGETSGAPSDYSWAVRTFAPRASRRTGLVAHGHAGGRRRGRRYWPGAGTRAAARARLQPSGLRNR